MGAFLSIGGYNPYRLPGIIYDDIRIAGLLLRGGVTPPTMREFRDGLYQFAFAGTGVIVDEAHGAFHLPHTYKAGTVPTIHIHWAHNIAAPVGDVKWLVDVSAARDGADAFGAPVTLSAVQTAGAQYQHLTTDDDDMQLAALLASLEPDALVQARVYRDPADAQDTFEEDAFLLEIDLHLQKGQEGTIERERPYRSAGFS